jgi:phosphoglycerate dehydrogenase-like enzyme
MKKLSILMEFQPHHLRELQYIARGFDVVVCPQRQDWEQHLRDCEILLTFLPPVNTEMLDMAPQLKWIQVLTAGVDNLPLAEIRSRGILLTNGRGIHQTHMAEYAVGAMIILARNWHIMARNQFEHRWDRTMPQGEISGSVAGILGLGSIGREVARKASCMGMRVIGVKRTPQPVQFVADVFSPADMGTVFRQSDYVINLLPYTPETDRIIDRRFFDLMKPSAGFINLGRGPTVREADLIAALQSKKLRAVVSDVFEEEPLPADSPLWTMSNVLLSPHIAGVSPRYMDRAMEIIRHNLTVYMTEKGEMINRVDLDLGY